MVIILIRMYMDKNLGLKAFFYVKKRHLPEKFYNFIDLIIAGD